MVLDDSSHRGPTARILDGAALARRIRLDLAGLGREFTARTGVVPGLVVLLVGDNPASQVYVRNKGRACEELGWHSEIRLRPATLSMAELLAEIDHLNEDPRVHGILLQLPLPPHLDEQALLDRIRPEKDVDGFHPMNVGRLQLGLPAPEPCTPAGVSRLLVEEGIPTAGRHAVIIGRSNIVGKPLAQMFLRKGPGGDATVTVAHSRTPNLPEVCRTADILVAAIGSPRFVQSDWIRPGATVIDVGINRIADPSAPKGTRLVGDVDFEAACRVAGSITPVPGAVGPMTIAMLLVNTLNCARRLTGDL
jgi:methylenetetrahydrofolate dehydrogenase (NADP+)/methenyltetrahydrofolate cyclohydrolase